jgi:hypothetical protein
MLDSGRLAAKYGVRTYQDSRNEWTQSTKESLLVELAKHGLGPRDLIPPLNLFSKVQVDRQGAMQYLPDNSESGDYIEFRAEMHTLVILCANHHPMEPSSSYSPKPVHLVIRRVSGVYADDPCRLSRPENARGFELTARYCP